MNGYGYGMTFIHRRDGEVDLYFVANMRPARTREHPVLMGWPDTSLMVTIPAQEPLTLTLSG